MSSLADRLRGVVGGPKGLPLRHTEDVHQEIERRGGPSGPPDPAEILGGDWREARGRKFLIVDRKYSPGYRHGRVSVADCLPPWPRLDLLASGGSGEFGKSLFLDLETTGLAGGAGTYAFLVGCGWFDGGPFRLRQFFLADFAAERALLESVAELAEGIA